MSHQTKHHTMRLLTEHTPNGDRCILVGKGPSAEFAKEHIDFGDVATLHEAALLVPGTIDYAFFTDVEFVEPAQPAFDRCRRFVVPEHLHANGGKRLRAPSEVEGLPLDGIFVYPRQRVTRIPSMITRAVHRLGLPLIAQLHDKIRLGSVARAVRRDRIPFVASGPVGIFLLSAIGYRKIWCFGLDGGHARAPGIGGTRNPDYCWTREVAEVVARCVRQVHGTETRFWSRQTPSWDE